VTVITMASDLFRRDEVATPADFAFFRYEGRGDD